MLNEKKLAKKKARYFVPQMPRSAGTVSGKALKRRGKRGAKAMNLKLAFKEGEIEAKALAKLFQD